MTGQRFGRWLVLNQSGNAPRGAALWLCRCDCGTERPVQGTDLRAGKSTNCGCIGYARIGNAARTHGGSDTRLHTTWQNMKARCYRQQSSSYDRYGGRGITVCDEWRDDFAAFRGWALSNGYSDELTIDRIDNDRGYEPRNCRWVDRTVQSRNRRFVRRREDGVAWSEIANAHGIPTTVLHNRIHAGGLSPEEAATRPLGTRVNKNERDEMGRFKPHPAIWKRRRAG